MADNIVVDILLGGITALAGSVAFLYRQQHLYFSETRNRLDECEHDRERLWKRLSEVSEMHSDRK